MRNLVAALLMVLMYCLPAQAVEGYGPYKFGMTRHQVAKMTRSFYLLSEDSVQIWRQDGKLYRGYFDENNKLYIIQYNVPGHTAFYQLRKQYSAKYGPATVDYMPLKNIEFERVASTSTIQWQFSDGTSITLGTLEIGETYVEHRRGP